MQPKDTIGYWMSSAMRSFASAFFEVLEAHCVECGEPYVITPPQWGVMVLLSHNDGQTISMLAQQLGLDAPAITNIVKRLEHSGLVKRVRGRKDQRVVKVSLTTEGQDIAHSLDAVVTEFNERLFSVDQRRAFLLQLQDLIATARAVAPGTGARFDFFFDRVLRQERQDASK